MIPTLLDAWLGPDIVASLPRYALLVAGGAQLVAVLAILTWLAAIADAVGELVIDVVAAVAGCVGRAVAAIEGA